MRLLGFFSVFSLLPRVNAIEPAPPDLGNNLSYLRVHSLADAAPALQSALTIKHACVLDLRYATANDESIAALRAALAGHPADSPLFILVSPDTPAVISDMMESPEQSKFITLGFAGSHPIPNIIVRTDAKADRQAYDDFESGTPLIALISGKIDKDRYDEATLVHEFKNGITDPEPPQGPDQAKPRNSTGANKPADTRTDTVEPLRDRVLQRALNLHQALLILRR